MRVATLHRPRTAPNNCTASLLSGTLHFRRHPPECLALVIQESLREYLDNERRHLGVFVAYSWVEALVPLTPSSASRHPGAIVLDSSCIMNVYSMSLKSEVCQPLIGTAPTYGQIRASIQPNGRQERLWLDQRLVLQRYASVVQAAARL